MSSEPRPAPADVVKRPFWHVPVAAFVGTVVFAAPSLTPSLLPHAAPIQGVVTGLAAACGYAVGLLAAAVVGAVVRRRLTGHGSVRSWRWLGPAGAAILVAALLLGQSGQSQLRAMMSAEPSPGTWFLVTALVAVVVCAALVAVGRSVRRLSVRARRGAERRGMAPRAAGVTGVVVAGVVVVAGSAAVVALAFAGLGLVFEQVNDGTTEGVTQPTTAPVSGSAQSLVSWASLGTDGRDFVASAPTQERIGDFTGAPAKDPVRVYVGVESAATPEERAALAVDDLDALGGFGRSVLVVATSTGTGFLDPTAIQPLEIMYGGDTAVVSMQYSTLPSWLSFLVDQANAAKAGTALFDAVHERWAALPEDARPRLLVFGESLGAYGAESAFPDMASMRAQTGGMLLVGPPEVSAVHRVLTEQRDAGSPQWQPVVDGGAEVRFAAAPEDLDRPTATWTEPRIAYLQNPSDPVVWWAPSLLWSRPDWLAEPAAPGTWAHQRWLPIVTFLKVGGDMMDSTSVPVGHGHVYGWHQVGAWARIAPPPGWTAQDTARLEAEFR